MCYNRVSAKSWNLKIGECEVSLKIPLEVCSKIVLGSDGWLSPAGLFFPCLSTEHDELAASISGNKELVWDIVERVFFYQYQVDDWRKLPARDRLRKLEFELINGPVLFTENSSNYSIAQMRAISESGILIKSAFDNSIEFPSKDILNKVSEIVDSVLKNPVLISIRRDFDSGMYSNWGASFFARTFKKLEQFSKYPLQTRIRIDGFREQEFPGEHRVFPSSVFDDLSKGYTDEMSIDYGRNLVCYRVTDFGRYKILSSWNEYCHDGLNGGIDGDYNNYLSISVIDDLGYEREVMGLFDWREKYFKNDPLKIVFSHKGTYFETIVGKVVGF